MTFTNIKIEIQALPKESPPCVRGPPRTAGTIPQKNDCVLKKRAELSPALFAYNCLLNA